MNYFSLKATLRAMSQEDGLRADHREFLERLAGDPEVCRMWETICPAVVARWFVNCVVLSSFRFAVDVEVPPAQLYQENAKGAQLLAEFLRGSGGLPPPLPTFPNFYQLADSLDQLAEALQDQAAKSSWYVSRQDSDGSRKRTQFMRLVSKELTDWYGRPFDKEVACLTDIAFPGETVTSAQNVADARRQVKRSRGGETE